MRVVTVGIKGPGVDGKLAVSGGLIVERELNGLGGVAVHRDDFVAAGLLYIDGVVKITLPRYYR